MQPGTVVHWRPSEDPKLATALRSWPQVVATTTGTTKATTNPGSETLRSLRPLTKDLKWIQSNEKQKKMAVGRLFLMFYTDRSGLWILCVFSSYSFFIIPDKKANSLRLK